MKKRIFIFIFVGVIFLSGCSYKQFEDNIRSNINGGNEEDKQLESILSETQKPIDMEEQEEEKKIHSQGKMVKSVFGTGFAVERSYIAHNYIEAGLDEESLRQGLMLELEDSFDISGNVIGGDYVEEGGMGWENSSAEIKERQWVLLLADVIVENMENTNDRNQDGIEDTFISGKLGTRDSIQYSIGTASLTPIYLYPCGASKKEYWYRPIGVGEREKVVLAWLIPEDFLEEELYVVIQTRSDGDETDEYIKLDMEK